mmetsp:Transcript_15595/g.46077  ORF Transcript_15595/g.46077 Transcript_15595/m.46077 type:complete len:286 (-) Transcript_15595:924-1781(-)
MPLSPQHARPQWPEVFPPSSGVDRPGLGQLSQRVASALLLRASAPPLTYAAVLPRSPCSSSRCQPAVFPCLCAELWSWPPTPPPTCAYARPWPPARSQGCRWLHSERPGAGPSGLGSAAPSWIPGQYFSRGHQEPWSGPAFPPRAARTGERTVSSLEQGLRLVRPSHQSFAERTRRASPGSCASPLPRRGPPGSLARARTRGLSFSAPTQRLELGTRPGEWRSPRRTLWRCSCTSAALPCTAQVLRETLPDRSQTFAALPGSCHGPAPYLSTRSSDSCSFLRADP